ncbi:MAG: T9SS type A sorting domain-containing protein [Salinibacter sp.]
MAWPSSKAPPTTPSVEKITQAATRSTAEDPNARRNYELRRLRDPATGQIPKNVRKKELAFADRMPESLGKAGASSWQRRGPSNVGGRSRALEIDVSDATHQTILAGGVSGGMWRTTDGGTTWTRTFDPDQRPNVTALDQDTRSGRQDVWFAGTGEYIGNSALGGGGAFYRGNGIYKSVDGGQSWTLLSSTTGSVPSFDRFFDYTWAVEVDPSAPTDGSEGTDSEVYVATYGRIQRSMDGGSTWTAVLRSDPNGTGSFAAFTDVAVTSGGVAYAALSSGGAQSGLFMSSTGDPGSWTEITPDGWPTSSFQRTVLAINPSDETEVWALTKASGSGPNGHELWMYDRDTDTWSDSTEYLPDRDEGLTGTFNSQNGYDLIAAVHPDSSNLVFVGGRNLWRLDVSADSTNGNTWIGGYTHDPNNPRGKFAPYDPTGSAPHHPDQHALAFEPGNGDVMYVGSDGGIHRTDNNRAGDTGEAGDGSVLWNDLNNGYFTTQFYAVCQFPHPDGLTERARIAGGMQDNGTWTTASGSVSDPWQQLAGGDGGPCALTNNATDDSTSRYVSTQNGPVFRLIYDENGVYQNFVEVTPPSASGQLFINPFALDPAAANVMYYPAGSNLWRNNDLEDSPSSGWTELTGAQVSGQNITAFGVSAQNDAHVLYYGTGQGTLKKLPHADTTDAATTPTDVTGTNFPSNGYVSSIAVDPASSDSVMVVFSNYGVKSLFYSTDGGSSWTAVEGNLGADNGFSPSVRSAAILPQRGLDPPQTTYYVGTSIGVYSTTALDGTNTSWTQESASKIGDVVVDQVQARAEDGRVIVGTHANGTYSISKPIPVELTDFDATVDGKSVLLTWTTASETNNSGFAIEHKQGDDPFDSLDFVPGRGSASTSQTYRYEVTDDLAPGRHTFRLRQTDTDGTTQYSEPQRVTLAPTGPYALTKPAPNPVRGIATMRLTVRRSQPVTVAVYNSIGQRVRTLLNEEVPTNRPLDLRVDGSQLASGLYVVQVRGKTFEATRKVTVVE